MFRFSRFWNCFDNVLLFPHTPRFWDCSDSGVLLCPFSRFRNCSDSRWYLFFLYKDFDIYSDSGPFFWILELFPQWGIFFLFFFLTFDLFRQGGIFLFFILFLLTIENRCHSEDLYINKTRHCNSEYIYIYNKTHCHSIDINKTKHWHSENFTFLFYRLTQ